MDDGNIYLIGYRCTGKTGVGRLLAESAGLSFVDTDALFVERSGLFVSEYVVMNGWKSFRRLESEIIKALSLEKKRVVATGGGAVLDPENVRAMKSSGRVVWLRASWETIYRRLEVDPATEEMRPALTTMSTADEIKETLAQREPIYRAVMDVSVETDDLSMDEVCRWIARMLEEKKRKKKNGGKHAGQAV